MLDHHHREIDIKVSLVDLVHDKVSVLFQRIGVVYESHEENSCCHEGDLGV